MKIMTIIYSGLTMKIIIFKDSNAGDVDDEYFHLQFHDYVTKPMLWCCNCDARSVIDLPLPDDDPDSNGELDASKMEAIIDTNSANIPQHLVKGAVFYYTNLLKINKINILQVSYQVMTRCVNLLRLHMMKK